MSYRDSVLRSFLVPKMFPTLSHYRVMRYTAILWLCRQPTSMRVFYQQILRSRDCDVRLKAVDTLLKGKVGYFRLGDVSWLTVKNA
jgi:hypothetical protein